jgi:hypothetical protein
MKRHLLHGLLITAVLSEILIAQGVRPPFMIRPTPGGAELIPAARLVDWEPGVTVGVPGGIPTGRTQCVTSACVDLTNAASGYKDGTLDAAGLIEAATASALADTVVELPAGTWRIDSTIDIGPSDDSITLRGASTATTIIDCRTTTCIKVGTDSDYAWGHPASDNLVTAYGVSGANSVLTMADTASFSTGQLIRWIADDDRNLPVMNVGGYGADDATYSTRQMTRIVSKTGTTLTVFPPIYHYADYVGVAAKVNVAQFQTDFAGIENLTVDGTNGTVGFGIQFEQTVGGWLKDVRVYNATSYHVYLADVLFQEIRRSTMEVRLGGGSNGSALLVNTVSGALVEDNIIREAFPNIEVNAGSSGNVFAYNFVHNENGAISVLTNHGPHNRYNLYEGNIATNFLSDGYFGGEDAITIYRNLAHANGIDVADDPAWCVSLKRFTRRASIVGNVFGGPESAAACELSAAANTLGKPNIGNNDSIGTAQPSLADWWDDFDGTDTTIEGQLTTRTSDTEGIITLSSGTLAQFRAPYIWSSNGLTLYATSVGTTVPSGSDYAVTVLNGTLPALNTLVKIWPGPPGYQELDLDVEETTIQKVNYDTFSDDLTGDGLDGATLVDSLFRDAKPSWFNGLTWPPVDPNSPVHDYEIIPAGYRYMNAGSDPP